MKVSLLGINILAPDTGMFVMFVFSTPCRFLYDENICQNTTIIKIYHCNLITPAFLTWDFPRQYGKKGYIFFLEIVDELINSLISCRFMVVVFSKI